MLIHDVEQGSDAWHTLRAGLPTASEFSKIVTSDGQPSKQAETYAITLAGEAFAGKPLEAWQGNQWTERGKELEAEAIRLYEFANGVTVKPVGFVTDAEIERATMGCSPDGLVEEQNGAVEVKCLKAENHIKAMLYRQKHDRPPPEYVQQTQGEIMATGAEWVDLIFFHPDLPFFSMRQTTNVTVQAALKRDIPKLNAERDRILQILRSAL